MRTFGTGTTRTRGQSFSDNNLAKRLKSFSIYLLVAGLFSTNVVLAIALYKSPTIAEALNSGTDIQLAAYENRIALLRTELDRLHSRQYAKSGDVNLQLQELASQQQTLLEQHDYVKNLAAKAIELGLQVSEVEVKGIRTQTAQVANSPSNIETATIDILKMQEESLAALNAIASSAQSSTKLISSELKNAGLSLNLKSATGGPYIPARTNVDELNHIDAANAALNALSQFQDARKFLKTAPIHRPLEWSNKYSSRFGNRRDPFTGRSAFHSGLDFRAKSGTRVRSLGAGKVTFSGKKGGYGNTVEVTHVGGLVSRYAHLSSIKVKNGQYVTYQTIVGLVGSTGRSTGPHLHLEVRRNDKAINPERFINAGQKLSKFLKNS